MNIRNLLPIVICIASTLLSCGGAPDNEKQLTTANNEILTLKPGEKNVPLDQLDKFSLDRYTRYINSGIPGQVPLNKAIFSKTGTYFVGIPIDGSVTGLMGAYQLKYSNQTVRTSLAADSSFGKIFAKDSAHYLLIEVVKTKANNLLIGALVGKDSLHIAQYYSEGNTLTRLSNETKQ